MNTVKLISEEIQDVEYICEEKENGKKDYKIKGIFMQADIKNRNGRVYPMNVLEKEVNRYNKEFVTKIVHTVNLDIQTAQQLIWKECHIWLLLLNEMVTTSLVKQKYLKHLWVK